MTTTIAIDAMGGDHGPSVTIPAAIQALNIHPHLKLILVGDEGLLAQEMKQHVFDRNRLSIHHASQEVAMDESPATALRTKKDSSMRVAINLVKAGVANAVVSAGNTGALMATARFVLKTLPGVDRPAIISSFPSYKANKKFRMLDLGANVDSSAEHLVQFAVMGSVLAAAVDNITNPTVYLLNIGSEEIKGNEQVKHTAQILSATQLINYAGFIEGDAIFRGDADVVVCDGFVGNIALKTTEGVALFIGHLIKQAFMQSMYTKFLGWLAKPVFKALAKRIDPAHYNGATLIGLNGIVIKSHGGSGVKAYAHAISEAVIVVEKNIPELIRFQVEKLLKTSSPPVSE